MKKTLVALPCVLILMILPCRVILAQNETGNLKDQLDKLLNQWHLDAARGDHGAYIGAMAADGVYIGTDATEHWSTAEFSAWCKPWFDRKQTWNFKAISRHIDVDAPGKTAWFDELLETRMGLCRGSGILVRRDGTWKIVQYVLSATIPNELMKQVTLLKASADSSLVIRTIFEKHHLRGTVLILDPQNEHRFGYEPALWDSGYLPASTFKIPNTLIGLETGETDTGYLFKWNGEKRRLPQWEKDLKLADAFRVSCVPCYQELARKTGAARMKEYLGKIGYPGMDVRPDNIDLFWLEGNSRITPRQQVDFLRRLNEGMLPVKKTVLQQMRSIMLVEKTAGYTLYGKTGWAIRDGNNYGWFVGWIETEGRAWYVATLVEPVDRKVPDEFTAARKLVTMEVLRHFGIIR